MSKGPVSDSELGNLVHQEIYQSDNRSGSEMQQNTSDAYDYFLYRQKGDEVPGRSTIQPGDVADMVDHVQAELQPMYSVSELVQIEPENSGDVQQAADETKAVNWYFRERCRGFEKLDNFVQDGLLLRNGYLKVWPEESYKLPYEETFTGTVDQIDALIAQFDAQGRVKVVEDTISQEAATIEISGVGPDGITPVVVGYEETPAIHTVKLMIIPKKNEILIEAVAREDMFVSRDAKNQNMQEPRFVAQRRWMTRSYAVSLGFNRQEVYDLPHISYVNQQTKTARMADVQRLQTSAPSEDGDIVQIYECYYLIDRDGDGIAERHKLFYANRDVLHWDEEEGGGLCDEIVRLVPFAAGTALTVAHRHAGRSLYDKEKAIEDSKRHLLRQGLDNIELANNRRPLLGPGVNPDDVEETEIGAYIRCAQGIGNYGEAGFTPIFDKTLLGLEYLDKMRRERGGSAIDMGSSQYPIGNTTAHTFERFTSSQEQMVAMYARNFANTGIRDAFVLLHQQLKVLGETIQFRDGDDWRSVEPRYWMDRERFTVKLGLSAGEKARRIAAYEALLEKQTAAMSEGKEGVLVDDGNVYKALVDQLNIQGLPEPEQYWIDPESPQAQQTRQMRAQAQQEAQAAAQAQQDKILTSQMQIAQLQEETKRLRDSADAFNDAQKLIQDGLDSMRDFIAQQTKTEAESGQDIPGGVLYGDEGVLRGVS